MFSSTPFSASQFVAHRGYARHYPENTLTAITAAIRAGAQCIEVDIQFSKDGIAFVYHDDNLQRVSGINGSVFDYTAEQLAQLPASEPERFGDRFRDVPISLADEFAQLIKVRPQIHFYVELKEESIAHFGVHHCLTALKKLLQPVMHNSTLISFDMEAMLLAKTQYGFLQTGIVFRDWAQRNALIARYQADVAYINIQRIPAEEPITADCPIVVYEIDDPAFAASTLQRGAAKVETFAIGELIEALCKQNMMSSL